MSFRLAIVGRPNVGKSTLFNRLCGKKLAIVHDQPGVTRDWKEAPAKLSDLQFIAIDTAGIEHVAKDEISSGMRQQTEAALKRADAVLMLVDGREGLTSSDRDIAKLLRKTGLNVMLAVNKCESGSDMMDDAVRLGLGVPIAISAEHNLGMVDLYNALREQVDARPMSEADELDLDDPARPIRVAFVGRPNVGKSTLMNTLLNEERSLVSPIAGTTRDPVSAEWEWQGRRFRLVDTAGLRKQSRIHEDIEKMAADESLRIIRLAEVVVMLVDATTPLEHQDLAIADLVMKEGRAFVLALNKWDLVKKQSETMTEVRGILEESLSQANGLRAVPISALKNKKLDTLMQAIIDTHAVWAKRLPTAQLNRWLEHMLLDHTTPLVKGRRVKIRYMTQRKARPPTFVVFCGSHSEPPESYLRYLVNGLRERFEMQGVPIRMEVKKGKNPYGDKNED